MTTTLNAVVETTPFSTEVLEHDKVVANVIASVISVAERYDTPDYINAIIAKQDADIVAASMRGDHATASVLIYAKKQLQKWANKHYGKKHIQVKDGRVESSPLATVAMLGAAALLGAWAYRATR